MLRIFIFVSAQEHFHLRSEPRWWRLYYPSQRPLVYCLSRMAKNKVAPEVKKDPSLQKLSPEEALVAHPNLLQASINAICFAVFIDMVVGTILGPNYALMCTPDYHKDSWSKEQLPSTELATNLNILMAMAPLGQFAGTIVLAPLSDKIGRKPVLLLCMYGGAVSTLSLIHI